jgi:tRNA(fMet)-specific endonuclease VapC
LTCLDTNFLIDWLRGNKGARRRYDELWTPSEADRERLSVSIVSVYELQKGAKLSENSVQNLQLVRSLLSELSVLELDLPTIDLASEIYSDLSRKGKLIGDFDILIGANCISHGQSLVTDDGDFDLIPRLSKVRY